MRWKELLGEECIAVISRTYLVCIKSITRLSSNWAWSDYIVNIEVVGAHFSSQANKPQHKDRFGLCEKLKDWRGS